MLLTNLLILLGGLLVLGVASHYLVKSSVHIARMFKVSEIWIGLTVVAMGTSAPEIAVSVKAALDGQGALSVGNVIGSNIFNLGFILGLVSIVAPQKISQKMVYRDMVALMLSTIAILVIIWNQFVTRTEGIILLALLVAYNAFLFWKKDLPEADEEMEDAKGSWEDVLLFVVSLYFLVKGSDYVVESAVSIAQSYGVSEWAIGATIVAAGTSLPEVATSLTATLKRKFGISIGNVVGSDIFNVLGIIGVSAVVAPLGLHSATTVLGLPDNLFSMVLLVATIVLVGIMMRTGWRLSRFEGALLLGISVARMVLEVYLGKG